MRILCLSFVTAALFTTAWWSSAHANPQAAGNHEYWQKFITEMDKILSRDDGNLEPITNFLSHIDTKQSIAGSESILESSRFYVDHAYSGLPNVYDFSNNNLIARIYFDTSNKLPVPDQTGARLKKTIGDYKIIPK